jgi:hypothetical protein
MNNKSLSKLCAVLSFILFSAGISAQSLSESEKSKAINTALDAFHNAASDADGKRYFELLHRRAVFIGTDGSERWTKAQFKEFAMPYFSKGTGWTYHPRD